MVEGLAFSPSSTRHFPGLPANNPPNHLMGDTVPRLPGPQALRTLVTRDTRLPTQRRSSVVSPLLTSGMPRAKPLPLASCCGHFQDASCPACFLPARTLPLLRAVSSHNHCSCPVR